MIAQTTFLPQQQTAPADPERDRQQMPGSPGRPSVSQADHPAENPSDTPSSDEILTLLMEHVWLIWLVAALGLLIRKITSYQGFLQYIMAGSTPVSDPGTLDLLSITAEQAGIHRPVELCVNPLISTPLLTGFFHPCIVLPDADISETDFRYIALHELIRYKRRDVFYKWLVQLTVCLHWFNPLVYVMSREITKACEFSCDEAVLAKTGYSHAKDYGKTLLDAMAAAGKHGRVPGTVTLSENKQLLKERLCAMMNFRKKSMKIRLLTAVLTLCVVLGAVFAGVCPAAAKTPSQAGDPAETQIALTLEPVVPAPRQGFLSPAPIARPEEAAANSRSSCDSSQIGQYYKDDSLPLFEITFPQLDEHAKKAWLETLYDDGDFAFFSVAVRGLDTDSSLFADLAEKAYADEEPAFFSILADCMDETEQKRWLDRALEDEKWDFQSMLYDRLDKRDECDERSDTKEKEWDAAQAAEYQAAGITVDGRDY